MTAREPEEARPTQTGEPRRAPPRSAARRPVAELTAAELVDVAQAELDAGQLSDLATTTRTVYLGSCLRAIRDQGAYTLSGAATFEGFAEAMGIQKRQRWRLLQAGKVPLELVTGRNIAECKLAEIGRAPDWLRPALCAAVDPSVGVETVRTAVGIARAERAAHASEADAIALALKELRDPTGAPRKPATRAEHGHRACQAIQRACDELAQAAGKPEGHGASDWAERSATLLTELTRRLGAVGVTLPTPMQVITLEQVQVIIAALGAGSVSTAVPSPAPPPARAAEAATETAAETASETATECKIFAPPAPGSSAPGVPATPAPAPSIVPGEPGYDVDLHRAHLERPCPLLFEGREYGYDKLGAALAARLDQNEQLKLNEAFLMLIVRPNRDDLVWRGEARVRMYASLIDDPELPRGLIDHWVERCIQPQLDDRHPYILRSLCDFRIADYRATVKKLAVHPFAPPYGEIYRATAERVPYAEFVEWYKHAPADFERYRQERNRLEAAGVKIAEAINGAMDIVRALRKAEGRG